MGASRMARRICTGSASSGGDEVVLNGVPLGVLITVMLLQVLPLSGLLKLSGLWVSLLLVAGCR